MSPNLYIVYYIFCVLMYCIFFASALKDQFTQIIIKTYGNTAFIRSIRDIFMYLLIQYYLSTIILFYFITVIYYIVMHYLLGAEL